MLTVCEIDSYVLSFSNICRYWNSRLSQVPTDLSYSRELDFVCCMNPNQKPIIALGIEGSANKVIVFP